VGPAEAPVQQAADRSGLLDLLRVLAPLLVLAAFAAIWQLGPLRHDLAAVSAWIESLQRSGLAPLAVVAFFVGGGLVVAPIVALILASVLAFGALWGGAYAMLGGLSSAVVTFGVGRLLGRTAVERLLGQQARRVQHWLAARRVPALIVMRNAPVVPFSVVNVVAGASGLRLLDFLLGTVLGLLPTVVVLSIFGDQMLRFVDHPTPSHVAVLVGMALGISAVSVLIGRLLLRR
jgi:phospholipase D1/2